MKKKLVAVLTVILLSLCFIGCHETTSNTTKTFPYEKNVTEATFNDVLENVKKGIIKENEIVHIEEEINKKGIEDVKEYIIEDASNIKVFERGRVFEIISHSEDTLKLTDDELKKGISKDGYTTYKRYSDGAVGYSVTKGTRNRLIDTFKNTVDESISNIVESNDNSFVKITYSSDFSKFDCYCYSDKYTTSDDIYALCFEIIGYNYQNFIGVDTYSIKVDVNFIDINTNNIILTETFSK